MMLYCFISTPIFSRPNLTNKRNNHLIILSLTAAVSASVHYCTTLSFDREHTRHIKNSCICEKGPTDVTTKGEPRPLSRVARLLYNWKLLPYSSLPIPRLINSKDPLFSYPQLQLGVSRRHDDEVRLRQMLSSERVMKARLSKDQKQMQSILHDANELVYGKGVSPQIRENFLAQYGCVGHTREIIEYLVDCLARERGIVEVGAGNGQWARALDDFHKLRQKQINPIGKAWDFVLAYDNMQELPLSPNIYHEGTVPAKQYFYNKVKNASHIDAVNGFASRGRVLLIVYPSPGQMALETVKAYVESSDQNDTVVYIGEGIGGANADDEFFDFFLGKTGGTWVLLKVMDVHRSPGGKGYEKMFVFQQKK